MSSSTEFLQETASYSPLRVSRTLEDGYRSMATRERLNKLSEEPLGGDEPFGALRLHCLRSEHAIRVRSPKFLD